MISLNCRSVIYEFLPTRVLINSISKLSKKDRKALITSNQEVMRSRGPLNASAFFMDYFFELNENSRQSVDYLVQITCKVCLDFQRKLKIGKEILAVEESAFKHHKEVCVGGFYDGNRNRFLEVNLRNDADFAQLERVSKFIFSQHFKKLDLIIDSEAQMLRSLSPNKIDFSEVREMRVLRF